MSVSTRFGFAGLFLAATLVLAAVGGVPWIIFVAAGNTVLLALLLIVTLGYPPRLMLRDGRRRRRAWLELLLLWAISVAIALPAQALIVAAIDKGTFSEVLGGGAVWMSTLVMSAAFWIAAVVTVRLCMRKLASPDVP